MRRLSARTCTAALVAIATAMLTVPLVVAAPAQAAPTSDLSITKQVISRGNLDVISVPADFDPALSGTRALGSYWLVSTGLRIRTEARPVPPVSPDPRKVAEYVDTYTPLSAVGNPTLEYTVISGPRPGYQLVTDLDNNGTPDVILVGENDYGANWWAAGIAGPWVTAGATPCPGAHFCRTLAGWSGAFPNAKVLAFGFTLGSGATGEGVINAINFAGVHYTFAAGAFAASTQAGPGETVEYQITVSNGGTPGTLAATDVVVTDVLPPELTYVPGSLVDSGNGCSFAGQALTCSAGTYPAGTASTIRFKAEINDELTTTTTGQVINQGHWVEVQKQEVFADPPAGQDPDVRRVLPGGLSPDRRRAARRRGRPGWLLLGPGDPGEQEDLPGRRSRVDGDHQEHRTLPWPGQGQGHLPQRQRGLQRRPHPLHHARAVDRDGNDPPGRSRIGPPVRVPVLPGGLLPPWLRSSP